MKRTWPIAGALLVLVGCMSLNKQPSMRDAVVQPPKVMPGERTTITVKISDRHNIVDRVVAIVEDYPQLKLPLRDDGTEYDVEAGDGVWTASIDVDFMAPPGDFGLIIAAFRSDGEPIVVSTKDKGDVPLAVPANISVQWATQGLPPEEIPEPLVEPPAAPEAPAQEVPATP